MQNLNCIHNDRNRNITVQNTQQLSLDRTLQQLEMV